MHWTSEYLNTLSKYSWSLNNIGLSHTDPLICGFFFSKVSSTVLRDPGLVGWICGCGTMDTDESHIWGPIYVIYRFSTTWKFSAPNPCVVQGSTIFAFPCLFLDLKNTILYTFVYIDFFSYQYIPEVSP